MRVIMTFEIPNELYDVSDEKLKEIILNGGEQFDSIKLTKIERYGDFGI